MSCTPGRREIRLVQKHVGINKKSNLVSILRRHLGLCYAVTMGSIVLIGAFVRASEDEKYNAFDTFVQEENIAVEEIVENQVSPIITASDFTNMRLGDIGKEDNIYVGLSQVKALPYLPTNEGNKEVSPENEVIIAYFDFYHINVQKTGLHENDVTCYADGIVTDGVEVFKQLSHSDGNPRMKIITCLGFEVKKGWQELKFIYDDCVWTITNKDFYEEKAL